MPRKWHFSAGVRGSGYFSQFLEPHISQSYVQWHGWLNWLAKPFWALSGCFFRRCCSSLFCLLRSWSPCNCSLQTCQNQVYKPKVKPIVPALLFKRDRKWIQQMNLIAHDSQNWRLGTSVYSVSRVKLLFYVIFGIDDPFPDTNPGIFTLDHKLLLRTGAINAHGGQLCLRFLKHLLP